MLKAINISKSFSGVKALSGVNLELHGGQVTAIIGENGAGKSTLMKILSGVYDRYEGEIRLNGASMRFGSTKAAEEAGVSIIHQELNLVPYLSVSDNIFLGREITSWLDMVDRSAMRAQTKDLLSKVQLAIDPDTLVAELKVGQQQLVEIAKALHTNAQVIIMDEPTSALSDKEVDRLFDIIRQLRGEGKAIAYISHKLNELFTIADRFVVLRDGQTVDEGFLPGIGKEELILKMTGRDLRMERSGSSAVSSEVLLSVKDITLRHPVLRFSKLLNEVGFDLHRGEILGVYGLMGAGRTELLECLFGLHPKRSTGTMEVEGKACRRRSPQEAINGGIALVPEDRKLHGLILDQNVRHNISVSVLNRLEKWGILSAKKEKELSSGYIKQLSIKTASDGHQAKTLSGGNQQKIVLAKWMATKPKVLLLDEPTRGVDVQAKSEIYALMKQLAAEGMGIVMVSSELPEILAVSDRVLVMCEGTLTASVPIEEATEAGLLAYALHKTEKRS